MKRLLLILAFLSSMVTATTPEEIVTLIDELSDAQAYWTISTKTPRWQFWKHSLESLCDSSTEEEATQQSALITAKKQELIKLLGDYSQTRTLNNRAITLSEECATMLAESGGYPCWVSKKWVSCFATVAGCASFYWYCQQQAATGNTNGWELWKTVALNPAQKVYAMVTNQPSQEDSVFTTNPQNNAQSVEELYTNALHHAQTTAQTAPFMEASLQGTTVDELTFAQKEALFTKLSTKVFAETPKLVKRVFKGVEAPLEQMYPAQEYPSASAQADQPKSHPIVAGLKNFCKFFYNPGKTFLYDAPNGIEATNNMLLETRTLAAQEADYTALFTEVSLAYAQQKNLQINELASKTNNILSLAPAALGAYAFFKGSQFAYRALVGKPYEAIKKDLLLLELELNKVRSIPVADLSSEHKGTCFYLITKLRRSADRNLPEDAVESFHQYLTELQDNETTPVQKITIIECMFKAFPQLIA